ncbi:hypothetical protein CUMW_069150 [Citrus unshiu]|nr:hypothetical protein CUMW_069150 [Citrus unshiu]
MQNHHFIPTSRPKTGPLCLVTLPIHPSHPTTAKHGVGRRPVSAHRAHNGFFPRGLWEPSPSFRSAPSHSFSGQLATSSSAPSSFLSLVYRRPRRSSSVMMDNLRANHRDVAVHSWDSDSALLHLFRPLENYKSQNSQEISIAANVPQKEIGKYIKILGEALQLSQPINSNSIAVHMPRFCTLLQLNKSAQVLATHIGEVVINKCFCTRRNPISISAAAIYLACQLEDKRKTQAEICKVTGLTEVTLRKVYKELLENWDDLLPSNYTPAVPPEKAFPTTTITSGRAPTVKVDSGEVTSVDKDKQPETKSIKVNEVIETESNGPNADADGAHAPTLKRPSPFSQPWLHFAASNIRTTGEKNQIVVQGDINEVQPGHQDLDQKLDEDTKPATTTLRPSQFPCTPVSTVTSLTWPFRPPPSMATASFQVVDPPKLQPGHIELKGSGVQAGSKNDK